MILHTERSGSGEPILFLHSSLQTGMLDFEQQRKYFTNNYRVIAADLRGHGQSVSSDLSNYLEDSADDIAETLAHLNLDIVHVVGASLGGLVGLFFAKRYPNLVKSLTISGVISEKPNNWDEIMGNDADKINKMVNDERIVNYFDDVHEGDWQEILELSQIPNWYPFEETSDLSNLLMPVLCISGEEDTYFPKRNDTIHISVIPFASDNTHGDQPEIYTQIVADFIGRFSS